MRSHRQLTVFIGIRAGECAASEGVPASAVNLWPEDGWSGALQAIPIYICAFGCHFIVLPVHGELAKPTRGRLHRMVGQLVNRSSVAPKQPCCIPPPGCRMDPLECHCGHNSVLSILLGD